MRLYSADITGSLVVSGSLIVTGSTAANPTIINPGGSNSEGKVFVVTGSAAVTRDLTIDDDLIVKDESDLEREVRIGYQSGETNYGSNYQLNVTASVNSAYSANFDGDLLITGSLVDKDNATGTAGQVLSSTGTQLSWVANDGAGITGTGTIGTVPKFTASTVLGNSIITETASTILINKASNPTSLQIGSSLADDPFLVFQTDGNTMSMGIDRGDSNKFKISDNATLGTNDRLTISTGGNVGMGGNTNPLAALDIGNELGTTYQRWSYDNPGASDYFLSLSETVTAGNVRFCFNHRNAGTTYPNALVFNNGNVGIGTEEPNAKLKVDGNAAANGLSIKSGGNSGKNPFMVTWASGTEGDVFCINDSLNVGIGTVSPNGKLDVRTAGQVGVPALGTAGNGINLSRTDGQTGLSIGYISNTGHTYLQSQRFDSANANQLLLNPLGGNVGIGTAAPAELLEIKASSAPAIQLNQNDQYKGIIRLAGNDLEVRGSNGAMEFYTGAADGDSSTFRMKIDSDGKITQDISRSGFAMKIVNTADASQGLQILSADNDTGLYILDCQSSVGGTYTSKFTVSKSGDATFSNTSDTSVQIGNPSSGDLNAYVKLKANGAGNAYVNSIGTGSLILGGNGAASKHLAITSGGVLQIFGTSTANALSISHDGGNNVTMSTPFLNSSQDLKIINSSAGVLLDYAATSWVSNSDENIKENIISLNNVLDKIKDIRCVNYNLKDETIYKKRLGFIAQDFQEDFAEVVNENSEGILGLRYTETIPILMKAIQEQQTIIEDLKSRIKTLEG